MEIKDFSDLTQFVADEYQKLAENYQITRVPDKSVKFVEKMLVKYTNLYNKPLYEKVKRDLILQQAIDTMPHGFVWKIFHWNLWQKIKLILKEEEEKQLLQQEEQQEPPRQEQSTALVGVVSNRLPSSEE